MGSVFSAHDHHPGDPVLGLLIGVHDGELAQQFYKCFGVPVSHVVYMQCCTTG